MAERVFPGAPTVGSDRSSPILLARIIDVDMSRYTVTARTEGGTRIYPDLPIGSPYAHYQRGEGFYAVPDVGGLCWIAGEGSGATPFVLGFTNLPKIVSTSERNDPDAVPQEGDETMASYGHARPKRSPGEFGFTARDGSFLHFRRGGIVELGAGSACQRVFLPLMNVIADVCESYNMWSAAGRQIFQTDRAEGSPVADAKALWRLLVKALGKDQKATLLFEAGHLGDNRYHVAIAPTGIDLRTGEVTGAVYDYVINASGAVTEVTHAAVTRTCGSFDLTVDGSADVSIGGGLTVDIAAVAELRAASWLLHGPVTIDSALLAASLGTPAGSGGVITLGGFAYDLEALKVVYNAHKHDPVTGTNLNPW